MKEGEEMNAQTKEKLKVTGWKVFWVAMRVVLTGLTAISVTLSLWNWSYSTRGYGTIGGEIILVPILALVTWWAIKMIGEYHTGLREELKKEEATTEHRPHQTVVILLEEGRMITLSKRKGKEI